MHFCRFLLLENTEITDKENVPLMLLANPKTSSITHEQAQAGSFKRRHVARPLVASSSYIWTSQVVMLLSGVVLPWYNPPVSSHLLLSLTQAEPIVPVHPGPELVHLGDFLAIRVPHDFGLHNLLHRIHLLRHAGSLVCLHFSVPATVWHAFYLHWRREMYSSAQRIK